MRYFDEHVFEPLEKRWLKLTKWKMRTTRLLISIILSFSFFILPVIPLVPMNSYKLFYFIQIILGIITIYISSLLLTSIAINRQKCKEASLRDSLTGLYDNREFFKEEIHRITNHSARAGGKTALLFADIDKFKDINAIFTHKGGDDILKSAAEILRDSTKRRDFVGRFGGDEFIIVFAFNDEKEIDTYIDRINSAFKSAHIFVASKRAKITLTFGVEIVDSETDIDKLFEAASEKMLAAKG